MHTGLMKIIICPNFYTLIFRVQNPFCTRVNADNAISTGDPYESSNAHILILASFLCLVAQYPDSIEFFWFLFPLSNSAILQSFALANAPSTAISKPHRTLGKSVSGLIITEKGRERSVLEHIHMKQKDRK